MTRFIQRLTQIITMHAVGLTFTHLAGWLIAWKIVGVPLPKLWWLFVYRDFWIIPTLVYVLWGQWFVWWRLWPRPSARTDASVVPYVVLHSILEQNVRRG